jgi:hypothetical protein
MKYKGGDTIKILEFIWVMCASALEMFFIIMVGISTIFVKILKNDLEKAKSSKLKTKEKKTWNRKMIT